jgi:hypothetical protein
VHLRHERWQEAAGAFRHAVDRVASHPAAAALGALEAGTARGRPRKAAFRVGIDEWGDTGTRAAVDLALAGAVHSMISGTGPLEAATGVARALAKAETGTHAWWLPVEPVLRVADHPAAWATVLAQLRARAA